MLEKNKHGGKREGSGGPRANYSTKNLTTSIPVQYFDEFRKQVKELAIFYRNKTKEETDAYKKG